MSQIISIVHLSFPAGLATFCSVPQGETPTNWNQKEVAAWRGFGSWNELERWLLTQPEGQKIWAQMTPEAQADVAKWAKADREATETSARKWEAVRTAAKEEAKTTGRPVAYADLYIGCGNVATRWSIATPDGRLETAVSFYVGPNKVYGEGYLSHDDARMAVEAYEQKRWTEVYAAA